MKRTLKNILVTGGAGFIGCNFIRTMLERTPDFTGRIINLDALTYAGNIASLSDIDSRYGSGAADDKKRYIFVKGDICDTNIVNDIFDKYNIDTVVHFAAESHVDRSIVDPGSFVRTNVAGTFCLLDAARHHWSSENGTMREDVLFHHISTDEVYGSLGAEGRFREDTSYSPRSPYSASKASSDMFVFAYHHTYGLPVTLSNCSNNYGPYQFPEKLIPLMILNMTEDKPLPVYGDGRNIRDWLFVTDHNTAVWDILQRGQTGEKYNIGGENEWENIRLLNELIEIVANKINTSTDHLRSLITFVKDRPGHDRRYAIDCSKIKRELGWKQSVTFAEGLEQTADWYLSNTSWIDSIRSGEYRKWIEKNYADR